MIDIMVRHMSKYFGETPILLDINFEIYEGRHVGLIGRNGAGKTTLFRVLTGEYSFEEGDVVLPSSKKLGVLNQIPVFLAGSTVEDVLRTAFSDLDALARDMEEAAAAMAAGDRTAVRRYGELSNRYENEGGYETDVELGKVCAGLSIDADMLEKEFEVLSGGEQTRVNLARMILLKTDILLLDEPTNHLDIRSVEWLEEFLSGYKGTVVIISHDRYFLDRTVDMIIELENLRAEVYNGNYSFYAVQKEARLAEQQARYEKEQREIKRLEFTSERMHGWGLGNKKMMRRAFALDKRIERLRRTERVAAEKKMRAGFQESDRSGNDVFYVRDLKKSFGPKLLFSDLTFDIKKDESIALIGDNGSGKSTLIRLLLGLESPDEGRVRMGSGVKIAYLPQLVTFENEYRSVLEEAEAALGVTPAMARNRLAAYHFTGEDVFKLVSDLSGGEKSRLRLCILMFSEINFLILDEPTNHLDIQSREWMEEALEQYEGTMLFVSHDRYFVNRFATRVLEIEKGAVSDFTGTYEEYRAFVEKQKAPAAPAPVQKSGERAAVRAPADADAPKKNSRERKKRLGAVEREIEAAEKKLAAYEEEMERAATDHEALTRLMEEREALAASLDALYGEWEELS